ncbi:MAG: FAD:protein FMN transferase [Candidatus Delongbacteria bacterium]
MDQESPRLSGTQGELILEAGESSWIARFSCFAGPCEIHLRNCPRSRALALAQAGAAEAWRIQTRFSRYRTDSWLGRLHAAAGAWVETDAEIEGLLDLADVAYQVSGGRFDLSSGVLRHAWRFEAGARPPTAAELRPLLARVGWNRVERDRAGRRLRLPAGWELDLGGLGKEYAVDRVAAQLAEAPSWLVNFGGDLRAGGGGPGEPPWRVGLDDPAASGQAARGGFELRSGALATSGDARRGLEHGGLRLGHILDARTGWPPPQAPRSVTVQAPTCSQAGLLSTLGLLMGAAAEVWLAEQGVAHWILRDEAAGI